jgi:MoCo/4Fe-4S cofactor protein with predicted Tat translocation signal
MSKRIWQHPEVPAGEKTISWRSVEQLEDTPAFRQWLTREFPRGAAEMSGEADAETSRRSFLKLMGASTALAGFGMAACRRPESHIVPYAKAPEWVIPGKALYYASAMPRAGGATPLVVTTFEGRPTKVAPNTLHPDGDGTDAFAQASILDLYSPSRSRFFAKNGVRASRDEFQEILSALAKDTSAKVGFVFGHDDSPSRTALVGKLAAKFSAAKFYQYEALASDNGLGSGVTLVPDFSKADRIVSLDHDFVGVDQSFPTAVFSQRRKPEGNDYKGKPDVKTMNRLYVVEGTYSLTGGMADHRLRVAPSQVAAVASQLASALGAGGSAGAMPAGSQLDWVLELSKDLKDNAGKSVVLAGPRQPAAVQQLAYAINVALGNVGEGKPLQVYQAPVAGNGTLANLKADLDSGAVDTVIFLTPSNPVYDAPADLDFATSLSKAKLSIHVGQRVDATAHATTWHVPGTHYLEQWSDARTASGVYTIVQPMILPLYPDCVSELELLVALLDDAGTLLNGEGEKGAASPAYKVVRDTFSTLADGSEAEWKALLREGFHAGSKYAAATPVLGKAEIATVAAPTVNSLEVVFATDASVYDGRWIDNGWLQEVPDPVSKLSWDNAALISPKTAKELGIYEQILALEPTNNILGNDVKNAPVHPDGESGNRKAPMITVTVNGRSVDLPVLIAFGQAENVIVLPVGYGQGFDKEDELGRDTSKSTHVGLVGVNRGFDVYPLRTSATPYFATGATVQLIKGKRYSLAVGQEHAAMYGRALAREITTMADEKKGSFEQQLADVALQGNDSHAPPNVSLYKQEGSKTWHPETANKKQGTSEDEYKNTLLYDDLHQWGMAIDLSSCSGCNSCVIACQAENNIPIVGKEQLAMGREMHWIRMDRYFAVDKENDFDPDSPELIPQPVACVQCESAPCETVCPVNATVHTEDGLNAMAYNRCIGTRYCANNCPYKARRFNYFDYNKRNPLVAHNLYRGPFGQKQVGEAPHLQRNPNVTVRMRGVMEKCTYCVQRLKDAKIRQKRGQKQDVLAAGVTSPEREVKTGALRIAVDSVKVACQEACSSGAITFGNLLDGDKSTMVRAKGIQRNYDLLNYIGTRPRTSYLARVKNPNPAMPDAKFVGKATIHMV